jgi:hypothetical protein
MASLNNHLQLALLNSKKGNRSSLKKGLTIAGDDRRKCWHSVRESFTKLPQQDRRQKSIHHRRMFSKKGKT